MHTRQAKNVRYSRAFIEWVLAAYGTDPAAALLDTPVVGLWATPGFTPTKDSLKADFDAVKATFTDYVKKTLTLGGIVNIGTAGRSLQGVPIWHMTTNPALVGNIVLGYWVEDADRVVCYEAFENDETVTMGVFGDSLILEILLPILYAQFVG